MTAIAILKLQRVGFTEAQVEALAEYYEAGAATKADIARLESKLDATRSDFERKPSDLERKIDITRSDLERAIEKLRSNLERKIDMMQSAFERKFSALELKIAEGKAETIRRVVGVGFAQIATIIAVLGLFPNLHP